MDSSRIVSACGSLEATLLSSTFELIWISSEESRFSVNPLTSRSPTIFKGGLYMELLFASWTEGPAGSSGLSSLLNFMSSYLATSSSLDLANWP